MHSPRNYFPRLPMSAILLIAVLSTALLIAAACEDRGRERARILAWSAQDRLGGLEARERPALPAPPGGRREITLAVTGDLKGWITTISRFNRRAPSGLAHLALLIRELRAEDPGLILLDAGDAIRGAPGGTIIPEISGLPALHFPILELMNALGYDATVLGNYDLGLGWASIAHAQAASDFNWLAANIEQEGGGTRLEPYRIVERKGVRVAVLGLTTPRVTAGLDPRQLEGLVLSGVEEAARRWVPFLRDVERADLVIGLVHEGLDGGYQRAAALRGAPPWAPGTGRLADDGDRFGGSNDRYGEGGFDLIVSGDAHRLSPRRPAGADSPYSVPVLEPGARGNALAVATFSLAERQGRWAMSKTAGMTRRTLPAAREAHPGALAIVAEDLRATRALLEDATALRFRRVPRRGEFQRCAGALSHRAAVYLAGDPAGGLAGGPEGENGQGQLSLLPTLWRFEKPGKAALGQPLRRGHLYRWMRYPDTLVRVRLTGRQIEILLEGYVRHMRKWRVPALEVLWPGGLRVSLAEKGSRIRSLRLASDGRPLAPQRLYPVWLTSYLRHGGLGLARRALIQPGGIGSHEPAISRSLRAGLFNLLSDPATEIPQQCARWLEK